MDCAALRTSSRTELRTDWVGWWGDQRVLLSYPANSDRSHPLSLSTPSILVSHHQKKILVSPREIPNHITAPGQPPSGSRATRRCDLVVFPIDYDLSILFPMPYVIIQCVIAACTIQYISRSSKFHLINNVSYLFHLELRVEINHLWYLFLSRVWNKIMLSKNFVCTLWLEKWNFPLIFLNTRCLVKVKIYAYYASLTR